MVSMVKDSITQEDFARIFNSNRFKRELRKSGEITFDTGYETTFNTYLSVENGKISVHPFKIGGTSSTEVGHFDEPDDHYADYPMMVRLHFHPGFGDGEEIRPSREDFDAGWILRYGWAEKKGLYVLPLQTIGMIDDQRNIDLLLIQDKDPVNPLGNGFKYRELDDLLGKSTPRPENVRDNLNASGYYNAVLTRLSGGKYPEGFFEQLKVFEHGVRQIK